MFKRDGFFSWGVARLILELGVLHCNFCSTEMFSIYGPENS
jgi:hypothetical protein